MGLAARVTGVTVAFALVAGGGYVAADLYDVVPGFVTLAPPPAPAAPFPIAPGAVIGSEFEADVADLRQDAPVPGGDEISKLTKEYRKRKDEIGKSVSILIVDAESDEVIVDVKSDTERVPASTVKLLVSAAALMGPGAETTLDTTVVQEKPGEIILVGGGDMMLAAGVGDPAYVNGRAGLADLAEQVATELSLKGQTEVTLLVDESMFTGPKVPDAVADVDVSDGYIAPVTPLAVNVALKEGAERYDPRYSEPSLAAAKDFSSALADFGVEVKAEPTFATAGPDAAVLGTVSSAPLGEIVQYVLETSDNTISELLGRLVALDAGLPGSVDGARKAVVAAVKKLGVDTTHIRLADTSGLGDGSKLPAQALVQLLKRMVDPKTPLLRDGVNGFPIAGLTGTLYDRYTASEVRGLVRAKTGSLPNVTSQAGTVITTDGRMLLFAVMLDKVPDGHAWDARALTDRYITAVASCECSS